MDSWNAGLEVGHADMDAEHRGLYDLTERAAGALEREDAPGVADALGDLHALSVVHFGHEEALMVQSAFEGLKAHREAHHAFMADFGKLLAELRARGLSPLFRLWFGSRFQDWLRFHIRGQDVQFYRHLRQWLEAQAREAEAALIAEARSPPSKG
jgi:hemerythrin-like metal-binding protein